MNSPQLTSKKPECTCGHNLDVESLHAPAITPEDFQVNETYLVHELPADTEDATVKRLIALGFVEHTRFKVHTAGDPFIVSFRGTRTGLDSRALAGFTFRLLPTELE